MGNPLKQLARDTVILKKQNGKVYSDIKANVQKNKIFIHDNTLPIEEGDRLVRTLSNGLEESYIVVDRGYYEKFHSIDAHYQCDVQKESSMQYKEWASSITNHFYGANSRVNIGSTDNSSNIVNINKDNIFDELRAVINENILSKSDSIILLDLVNNMEETRGTPSFIDKYKNFMESAANHMSVFSPLLPALAQVLA
ncbi:hypothetical protein [Lysinibacillus sp. BPa_S21]|uniref:hypothetical protein n=1 Tax=Lysinibacillus sp. BPa_S21 TaxID=2932478 RepID=UPI002012413E|nr:hypothetical protein [Lysinibacillus sp. BPa_S21]MCL1696551.1 hypothetical protein [Lysinibacillus sp. BPa_S21]